MTVQTIRTPMQHCLYVWRSRYGFTFILLLAITGCSLFEEDNEADPTERELNKLRKAVIPFSSVAGARAAGYVINIPDNPQECLRDSQLGAMGFHFGNADLIPDRVLNVTRPEVLIYEPQADGTLVFVGVEYVVPFSITAQDDPPPRLFGQDFIQNERFQVWALHAWVGRENPGGIFASYNPEVSCQYASAYLDSQ